MMGVTSGLELLTLPHGRQLRLDLLERYVVGGVLHWCRYQLSPVLRLLLFLSSPPCRSSCLCSTLVLLWASHIRYLRESGAKPGVICVGRFNTMSIMMAVDLLGCTGSTEERAALLHKTIQLAAELKSSLGNMFGFAAVMRALELPQVRMTALAVASRR